MKVFFPTLATPGCCPQPVVSCALQVAAFTTATRFAAAPKGTYMVRVTLSSTGEPGAGPTFIVGGAAAQPMVSAALHVAVLITETVSENALDTYRVWVAGSIAPTLGSGFGTDI